MNSIPHNLPHLKDIIKRFWEKVDISDEKSCWEWKAATRRGYGDFNFNGKTVYAHRVSYMIAYDSIPDGLCICHHCDNPVCVNPNHLFAGTNLDNIKDRIVKGRTCRGSKYWSAKLKREDVLEIKELYKTGKYTQKEIGEMFGVNNQSISNVLCGKTWAWIND